MSNVGIIQATLAFSRVDGGLGKSSIMIQQKMWDSEHLSLNETYMLGSFNHIRVKWWMFLNAPPNG